MHTIKRRTVTEPPVDTSGAPGAAEEPPSSGLLDPSLTVDIACARWRHRAQVKGQVWSVRIRPWNETPVFEAVLRDQTGGLTVAFLGRRSIGGIIPGAALTVEGMVGSHNGKLVMLNPAYDLHPGGLGPDAPASEHD